MSMIDLFVEPASDPIVDLSVPNRVELQGACSINAGEDIACSTLEMHLDRLSLRLDAEIALGDAVTVSLPHVGLQKGIVARLFPGGAEIELDRVDQSKLAAYLDWLSTDLAPRVDDDRRYERVVPLKKLVSLERAGEEPSMARLIDISRSGAAFTSSKQFAAGERVKIGLYAGRVVRLLDGGAAVDFDTIIQEPDFAAIQLEGVEGVQAVAV